jgi:hypothetical protein
MGKLTMLGTMLLAALFVVSCNASPTAGEQGAADNQETPLQDGDLATQLATAKDFTLENAHLMKEGTAALADVSRRYRERILAMAAGQPAADPYEGLWQSNPEEVNALVQEARDAWRLASQHYELVEGIVAGVPELASFDVWIDAGPTGAENPAEAYDWTLELPDGRTLERPGNFFHSLLEPAIWGTTPAYAGAQVDLNGDGRLAVGEAMPEAAVFLAAAEGLDGATEQMIAAIESWDPSLSDAFTALVVMVPTMSEYFEQWKLSTYVAGAQAEEAAFVGLSRLFDITNILVGLDVTYDSVAPLVIEERQDLHDQIDAGFAGLRTFVEALYAREQEGETFSAEEADLFGTEAQDRAMVLVGQIAQAAGLLDITLAE